MDPKHQSILEGKLDSESLAKLSALNNEALTAFVVDAIELTKPDAVMVFDDSDADAATCRQMAIDNHEEIPLAIEGHTAHFDNYFDQGRDPLVTKYLLPEGVDLGERLRSMDRSEGLAEVRGFLDGSMAGRTMLVRFFCLGPVDSPFSIPCAQITDSAYVCHSEDMLYRRGYEQFKRLNGSSDFFRFLHSAGEMENNVSANMDDKRIYIDITEDMVYSVNTQYAGNTVGLKKLALRLAIRKADQEGWLAEHMFLMGVNGPEGRKTYFAGAFPSACGKTSTAMLPGETIVGDDLAYLRVINGEARGANVEAGIFGIIRDVNAKDDPLIYEVLQKPGEVIFGNVLLKDGKPYWLGMGQELPKDGTNYAGDYTEGMTGPDGKAVTASHKNARYTVRISDLANQDEALHEANGVLVGGVMYGGRDSDTSVPVQESFDWNHGILTMGATLESESTAATVGAEGVRKFDLMSILQFLAIPLGKYIQNNLDYGQALGDKAPLVFGTNYFLKGDDGDYLNGKLDKSVWVKWMELRVNGDVETIEAPTGRIPVYADLKKLFAEVLDKEYTEADYVQQFTIRVPENLAKLDRIEAIYRKDVPDAPQALYDAIDAQRARLNELKQAKGEYVSPLDL